ncbi:hypothetical protein PCANB_002364 [Pneumocystis canis]|nr:hypothetical protein PCANB_002364 [Pneumocystis canis]
MRISEEQIPLSEDLHQIEIKDQRYEYFFEKSGSKDYECLKKNRYYEDETNKKNTIIDVLYENQRGASFCGTLMFSPNSLLFFDPPPWTDKNFRYSPVNISTATCPGPSWKWTWDKWKIDMYGNVDAEGWSYSFSFWSKKWYGTCIWFHSFKRVDDPYIVDNDNYFTINSSFRLSGPPTDAISLNESINSSSNDIKTEIDIEDLLKKLKESRIDRERLYILKSFILSNNQKINLLKDFIKEILECFIFQESRRQFFAFLIKTLKTAQAENHTTVKYLEEIVNLVKKEVYKYDFLEDR